jgi:predicted nuclease with TOPRIM domain
MSELLKEAKIGRRNAKAALTRAGKTLRHALHVQRPAEEVKQSLTELQEAYENLVTKHEEYTKLIEDDAELEKEEAWLADCQEAFMNFEIEGKTHLDNVAKQVSEGNITNSQPSASASDAHNENNSDQNENNNVNLEQVLPDKALPQNRNRAEASLVGKKCARMSADFRCGRHVESNQTRGNFIGVNIFRNTK